jgi:hypothetical protein
VASRGSRAASRGHLGRRAAFRRRSEQGHFGRTPITVSSDSVGSQVEALTRLRLDRICERGDATAAVAAATHAGDRRLPERSTPSLQLEAGCAADGARRSRARGRARDRQHDREASGSTPSEREAGTTARIGFRERRLRHGAPRPASRQEPARWRSSCGQPFGVESEQRPGRAARRPSRAERSTP